VESKGAQISVEEPKFSSGKLIVYWFNWAAVIRNDRWITYKHRHNLRYKDSRKRKGCTECGDTPPKELKTIALLQQLRNRDG
jgi:hypothetical protein